MPVTRQSNTEKEVNFFISRLHINNISQTAEIHEVDMSGWVLFECYLHPAETVVYIGWDEEAHVPEWIDMEDDVLPEYIPQLTNAILQFKKGAKAA
jgi:hypothetical protein